jgi:hypothetical protein
MNPSSIEPGAITTAYNPNASAAYSTITVREPAGNAQMLYVGKENGDKTDRYELPPRPPFGTLDVRFGSNRMVELLPERFDRTREYPLAISSESPAVNVEWNISADQSVRLKLRTVNSATGKMTMTPMIGKGEALLSSDAFANVKIIAQQGEVPVAYALRQNYPNPFNPTTKIQYELPSTEHVSLMVYDILGKEVAQLVNETQEGGYYEIPFSAERLATGVYFYRLVAGKFTSVQKMMIVK